MTRDGLVEQNQSNGDERRISQREKDISLQKASHTDERTGRYFQNGTSVVQNIRQSQSLRQRLKPQPQDAETVQLSDSEAPHVRDPTSVHHGIDKSIKAVSQDTAQSQDVLAPVENSETSSRQHLRFDADSEPQQNTPQQSKYVRSKSKRTLRPDEETRSSSFNYSKEDIPTAERQPQNSNTRTSAHNPAADSHNAKSAEKARNKLDKTASKLEKARSKLPSAKQGFRQRLRFEGEKFALATDTAVGFAGTKAHEQMRKYEHENVGLEGAHKVEYTAESLAKQTISGLYRYSRDRPARLVAKLEQKHMKANINYLYQRTLSDNPEMREKHFSRFMQKRRIKRQYQKAARNAKKGASAAVKGTSFIAKIMSKLFGVLGAHKGIAIGIAASVLVLIVAVAGLSSCAAVLTGGMAAVFIPSYKAGDADIHDCELLWTELEQDLQERIDHAERDHSGYDEYRYRIGEISHDPFELIAFLSAMYDDFQHTDITAVIKEIFNQMYDLQFISQTETRHDSDGDSYDWHILNVVLEPKSLSSIITPMLEERDANDMYTAYMDSYGGHQKYGNPLRYNWYNNITCLYGNRKNPTGAGYEIHRGLDIGATIGTPLYAIQDGIVISASWHNLFGNTIIVEDKQGRQTRFAHCNVILASVGQKVKRGEKIAEVGNTGNSTGPHVHVEIKENGQYLNPLFLLDYSGGTQ